MMEKISWTEKIANREVLKRVNMKGDKYFVNQITKKNGNCVGWDMCASTWRNAARYTIEG